MVKITLVDSIREVQEKVTKALAKDMNQRLNRAAKNLEQRIKPILEGALYSSPEIGSLSGGTLAAEFGLESDPTGSLVRAIVASIEVRVSKATPKSLGGFELVMQPTNFNNLLGLSVAEQPVRGGSIPWLRWLLTAGDTVIIRNFGVEYGPYGRTGEARMVPDFAPYKVNSMYSGTAENNFITRAASRVSSQIEYEMKKAIQ
tara:strand:- start:2930 stop:3535 length:606 start_codon:yes stop_codon:yes gene_type:complete